ncbi:hypothetical protein ANRL3_01379 [Anaerolineae bacterium]|nr:hypothetical protein ANRL3_01379 [Anaerolineae bacterium]
MNDNTTTIQVTTMIMSDAPTLQVVASEDGEKENALELAAQEASEVTFATSISTTEYSTDPMACQIAIAPTLEEIENEIKAAAQRRIEAALRDLNEARARIEREGNARELALKAAQERVRTVQAELDGLAGDRAEMERRAQTFLTGDALKTTMEKIHLAFNVRQLELEDTLAQAGADVEEMRTEIQAALISDGLEIQFASQSLEHLETAAPDVAEAVRLAADAQENLVAAMQAIYEGLVRDAQTLLDKAKAGNADAMRVTEVEQAIAEARRAQIARDLVTRIEAHADQIGAVRRIKKLTDEAEVAGVADRVRDSAERALEIARQAANARYAQARPIADHLASEGFVPVVGDGRIEVWQAVANYSRGHGTSWTLDRVIVLRGEAWAVESPRVPVTRKELPQRVKHSRWFKHPAESDDAAAN